MRGIAASRAILIGATGAADARGQDLPEAVAAETMVSSMDVGAKKAIADTALNAARDAGATYCDVRIGRYLNQFVVTREDKVQNVVNTESLGVGVRVIANGTWGFSATSDLRPASVAAAAQRAVAIAKANSKTQTAPVVLAPTPGLGEVSWKTPIVKNAMRCPSPSSCSPRRTRSSRPAPIPCRRRSSTASCCT